MFSIPWGVIKCAVTNLSSRLIRISVSCEWFDVVSPNYDMVQGSGYVESRLAWHGMILMKRV